MEKQQVQRTSERARDRQKTEHGRKCVWLTVSWLSCDQIVFFMTCKKVRGGGSGERCGVKSTKTQRPTACRTSTTCSTTAWRSIWSSGAATTPWRTHSRATERRLISSRLLCPVLLLLTPPRLCPHLPRHGRCCGQSPCGPYPARPPRGRH